MTKNMAKKHRDEEFGMPWKERQRLYRIWNAMLRRCLNEKATSFKNYGARGITVCDRWMMFGNFARDMGPKPLGLSLDRIDNNGGYEPSNCRWASWIQQGNNRRTNHLIVCNGTTKTMTQWSRETGVPCTTIFLRLSLGWSGEKAVAVPAIAASKRTYCPHGHIYDDINTRFYRNGRYCRTCHSRKWLKSQGKRR